MGKKGRKTRWRTLTITDEHSDSEESNTTTSGHRVPKGYPQKSYYSRFTYSSQSTPTRRYQCDGTKSTRSSSTASENKITFNEDEYTRITTPRQDVLFKKGYLNKPKTYQTQTSTGNSTTSTGNSTGNGTPDHQSTDLEYESQFVFPNGFVDQNGIYYVNSFEPYPLMVFNPPTYYPEFTSVKSKRCSTGSLTESTSPNNEEASQDLSQSETPSNVSDFNHCYNVIYPGFYFNGACQPQDVASQPEPRRIKKRRRRKLSRSKSTTSEYTDESSDEVFSDNQEKAEKLAESCSDEKVDAQKLLLDGLGKEDRESVDSPEEAEKKEEEAPEEETPKTKYDLKPDAEEFVPRAYRHPETIPMDPNIQFIKIPPNFVPLPILNPVDFNGQNFNAFIPPGIPINFIPQNYINFIPNAFTNKTENATQPKISEKVEEAEAKETVEVPKNQIDIAKIVSKLEEAAKEQDNEVAEEATKVETPKPATPTRKPNTPIRSFKRSRYQKVEEKSPEAKPSPKKEPPQVTAPKPRNYSDLLKKPVQTQQCERHEKHMEKQKLNKTMPSKEITARNNVRAEQAPKSANQWISVSNRKKRKNRNVEEFDNFEDAEENDIEKDAFESYDVKLLEDVPVVASETVAEPPTCPPETPTSPPKETETVQTESVEKNESQPAPEVVHEQIKDEIKEEKKEKTKSAPKKKSKKNQKPITKRVIIKDVDLSLDLEKNAKEEKVKEVVKEENVEEIVVKEEEIIDEAPPEQATEDEKVEVVEQIEDKTEEIVEEKKETPEKKMKKKKKKMVKPILNGQSSSIATLSMTDDSYDFLLENSILDDSQEKTNLEVSQELDKMIQRGMYSSLEEKIKSMNIESNDNFFKSVIHNISSREPSVEKGTYKTPDFSKILNTTSQLLKPKPVVLENKLDFLGESTPKSGGEPEPESPDEKLYPITKAVKEWMTKTRETTPDVEILKSPSTIFREFGEKHEDANSLSDDTGVDDDVTLYSFSREGSHDLLDCWEDEIPPQKTTPSSTEEGDDVLEAYESSYGKNEDYLKIKAEVEEKKASPSFPKHGNLPYRAICCSIM